MVAETARYCPVNFDDRTGPLQSWREHGVGERMATVRFAATILTGLQVAHSWYSSGDPCGRHVPTHQGARNRVKSGQPASPVWQSGSAGPGGYRGHCSSLRLRVPSTPNEVATLA